MVVVSVWEADVRRPMLTRKVRSLKAFGSWGQGAPPFGFLSDGDSVQSLYPVITNTRPQRCHMGLYPNPCTRLGEELGWVSTLKPVSSLHSYT